MLYSGSINSTSLLCNFVRCVDIKYKYKKTLLKKVNTARYEWKRFWYFKVYYFSALVIYHSHINWKLEVKNYKIIITTAVQKEAVLDCVDIVESSFLYQMSNACCESYTLESVQKSDESDNQTLQCGDES